MAKAATAGKRASERTKTKGDVTRERIRAAVTRLISRRGVNNVILQDICDEAGITHGGFYFHYARKEDAMIDVAEDWIGQFKTRVIETPEYDDFYAEIFQMIVTYIRGYTEEIEVTRMVYALDPLFPEVRQAFSKHQRRWWARLQRLFEAVRRDAGLPTGMELWIVHAMTSALEGVCVDAYLARHPELLALGAELDRTAERIAVIWHRAVLGCDPDPKKLSLIRNEIAPRRG